MCWFGKAASARLDAAASPCYKPPRLRPCQAVRVVTQESDMRDPRVKTIAARAGLSSLAMLVPSLAVGFPDEPAGPKTRPIKILASPSILQPGTPCRIEVDEQPPTVIGRRDDLRGDRRRGRRRGHPPRRPRGTPGDRSPGGLEGPVLRPLVPQRLDRQPPTRAPPRDRRREFRSVTVLPAGTLKAARPSKLGFVPLSPRKAEQKP